MRGKCAIVLLEALLVAMVGGAQPARAATAIFYDKADFEAAAPGLLLEDFESGRPINSGRTCDTPLSRSNDPTGCFAPPLAAGPTFSQGNGPPVLRLSAPPVAPTKLLGYVGGIGGNNIVIDFATPGVRAVGFNLWRGSIYGLGTCFVVALSGADVVVNTSSACDPSAGHFVGFTSTVPITRVYMYSPWPGSTADAGIDNLQFGIPTTMTANPVLPSLTESARLTTLFDGDGIDNETVSFTDIIGPTSVQTSGGGRASCCAGTALVSVTLNFGTYQAAYEGRYPYGRSSAIGTL